MQRYNVESLLVGNISESTVKKNNEEIRKIRDNFIMHLQDENENLKAKKQEYITEENKLITDIETIVNSDEFRYVFANKKYREKVINMLGEEELYVGKSRSQLQKLKCDIVKLKELYNKAYEKFVSDMRFDVKKSENGIDVETGRGIQNQYERFLLSKNMFNELSNSRLYCICSEFL